MKIRVIGSGCVIVLCGLLYLAVSITTSNAQTTADEQKQDTATVEALNHKVARLEKQLERLQKKVDELERSPRLPATIVTVPSTVVRPRQGVPRGWHSFEFNGQTYYTVPLNKKHSNGSIVIPTK